MTLPAPLSTIRTCALALADRYDRLTWVGSFRVVDLRHIAVDCQAAIDGCPASLESVTEFVERDHELWIACEQASVSTDIMEAAE